MVTSVTILLISIHPQPVDPCPCFEDAVAFMSVLLGILLSHWHAGSSWSAPLRTPLELGVVVRVPALRQHGWWADGAQGWLTYAALKITVGVAVLLIWRIIAKQLLHLTLPVVIRVVSPYVILPRRHYEPSK
jgi:hypothetical protein